MSNEKKIKQILPHKKQINKQKELIKHQIGLCSLATHSLHLLCWKINGHGAVYFGGLLLLHHKHQYKFPTKLGMAIQGQKPSTQLTSNTGIAWQCIWIHVNSDT